MDETFYLAVKHENKETEFPARFMRTGYSYKIQVDVYGTVISFEPDEERNWRALAENDPASHNQNIKPGLLLAIAEALEDITK